MDFVNNFCSTTSNNSIVFCLCNLYNVNYYKWHHNKCWLSIWNNTKYPSLKNKIFNNLYKQETNIEISQFCLLHKFYINGSVTSNKSIVFCLCDLYNVNYYKWHHNKCWLSIWNNTKYPTLRNKIFNNMKCFYKQETNIEISQFCLLHKFYRN